MFEKEAEEYNDNTRIKDKNTYVGFPNERISELQDYEGNYIDISERIIKAFKDGAELGYNKANEWQYPSKDEYPKECENVWCYCKGLGFKFCCVGHTIVGGDNKVRWWNNCKSEELRVIAWKEIVLPKESE